MMMVTRMVRVVMVVVVVVVGRGVRSREGGGGTGRGEYGGNIGEIRRLRMSETNWEIIQIIHFNHKRILLVRIGNQPLSINE